MRMARYLGSVVEICLLRYQAPYFTVVPESVLLVVAEFEVGFHRLLTVYQSGVKHFNFRAV